MREGDDDALARAHERGELVLGFRQPTGDEGRPLRLEGERLARGKRVQQCRLAERHRLETLFLPDRADLVGLPHEIGTARHGPHQVGRDRDRLAVVDERRLDQIQAALGGRIDDRRLDRMQCALRERRERAHLLDLVAPELDAQRLAARRREDVDEPAANGELAALVGALDTFVARERERLGELLEADPLARRDPDRLRPRVRRRHRLGERRGRSGDEPAGGEHVERACALTDEVRRGFEAGAPVDAPARQHRDAFVAEEPGGAFGGVAGVLILRREQHERAVELLVERGEQQRQRRLRDAGRRRKRLGKAFEAFGRAELRNERVQDRLVHDERPNPTGSGVWGPREDNPGGSGWGPSPATDRFPSGGVAVPPVGFGGARERFTARGPVTGNPGEGSFARLFPLVLPPSLPPRPFPLLKV